MKGLKHEDHPDATLTIPDMTVKWYIDYLLSLWRSDIVITYGFFLCGEYQSWANILILSVWGPSTDVRFWRIKKDLTHEDHPDAMLAVTNHTRYDSKVIYLLSTYGYILCGEYQTWTNILILPVWGPSTDVRFWRIKSVHALKWPWRSSGLHARCYKPHQIWQQSDIVLGTYGYFLCGAPRTARQWSFHLTSCERQGTYRVKWPIITYHHISYCHIWHTVKLSGKMAYLQCGKVEDTCL